MSVPCLFFLFPPRPERVVDSMRPCGAPPKVGDGIVCLPTLVHRGPGQLLVNTTRRKSSSSCCCCCCTSGLLALRLPNVGDGIVCLPTLVHRGPGQCVDSIRRHCLKLEVNVVVAAAAAVVVVAVVVVVVVLRVVYWRCASQSWRWDRLSSNARSSGTRSAISKHYKS